MVESSGSGASAVLYRYLWKKRFKDCNPIAMFSGPRHLYMFFDGLDCKVRLWILNRT